jgi:hypothetical protein
MTRLKTAKLLLAGLAASALLAAPPSAFACAACVGGKTDSALAAGMNWGIFSLMGVVACVLGGIASFAVVIARRSASVPVPQPKSQVAPSTQKS